MKLSSTDKEKDPKRDKLMYSGVTRTDFDVKEHRYTLHEILHQNPFQFHH